MIYNPVYEFDRLKRIADEVFGNSGFGTRSKDYSPTNIYENDNSYMIQFMSPGVNSEAIDINFGNGLLTVNVKRKKDTEAYKNASALKSETGNFDFTRSFNVPDNVDIEKIDAKITDGILMVHLPKTEKAKPQKISVKVQ